MDLSALSAFVHSPNVRHTKTISAAGRRTVAVLVPALRGLSTQGAGLPVDIGRCPLVEAWKAAAEILGTLGQATFVTDGVKLCESLSHVLAFAHLTGHVQALACFLSTFDIL